MPRTLMVPLLLAVLLLAAGPVSLRLPAAAESAAPSAADIKSLLAGEGALTLAGRSLDRAELKSLYDARDDAPVWIEGRAEAVEKAIAAASEQGLDPADFAVPAAPADARELLLTDAFLRYAAVLARGEVSSQALETDWSIPAPKFDAAATLATAAAGDPAELLASLEPSSQGYKGLEAALKRYRALAAAGGWKRVPETGKLKLGDSGAAVERLRRRLAAEGFLPADSRGKEFDAALDHAVRRFQALRGIQVDGTVGHDTYVALNVPVTVRLAQIRDNLERWRELPRYFSKNRIEVNVPAAWLTVIHDDEPAGLAMRAIVGMPGHPTPVLRAWMNAVLFNPPWNVPPSIVRKEILPKLKRDPHYLARNHYVYVGAPGRSAIQQLPGPDNALGRIKFELPNMFDVYLHDTPSHPLFSRVIRTLSHGCVRLEEPRQLALYVLGGGKTIWTLDDIDGAIAEGDTKRVPLAHDIPVYLLYWTAFTDPDGALEFRDDIYGRDARLDAALDQAERLGPDGVPPPYLPPPAPTPAPGPAAAAPAALPLRITKTAAD